MNAKRQAELDQRPDRATGWELAYAALASLVLLALGVHIGMAIATLEGRGHA